VTAAAVGSWWRAIARLWRFDLQRFRVLIVVVVGLELLRAAFVEWVLHRDPLATGGVFGGDGFGGHVGSFEFETMDGALWLATAITTAILVQADHPVDDRAFWRTRPVSAGQLAVAKLSLLAVLFVLVPLLVNTARLVAYRAPVGAVAASAVQLVVIGGSIVVPAWALAIAARTLPRFLALAAGVAIAWYVAIAAAVTFVPSYILGPKFFGGFGAASNGFAPAFADWQAVDRHGWVLGLLVTVAAAGLLIAYYRTRRATASIAAGLALIALPLVVPRRDLSVAAGPELAAIVEGGLRLDGSLRLPAKALVEKQEPRPGVLPLRGSLALPSALPLNVSASPEFGQARLTAPDATWTVEGSPYCCDNVDTMAAMAAASGTVPEGVVTGPFGLTTSGNPGMPWNRIILFTVPTRDADRLRGRAVGVEAAVRLQFARHRLVADLPLRAGVAFRTDDYLIEILAVESRSRVAICRFARFPALASLPGPPLRFFVGNPPELVFPAMSWWREKTALDGGGGIGWVQGRTWVARMTLPLDLLWHRDRPPPLPTRLYIVESRPAGELRTTIAPRDVPVIDTSDPPGADRRY
jgi:hypothetical protein